MTEILTEQEAEGDLEGAAEERSLTLDEQRVEEAACVTSAALEVRAPRSVRRPRLRRRRSARCSSFDHALGALSCDESGPHALQGQDITGFGFSTSHAGSVTFSVYATMDAGEETPYKYPP